MQNLLCLALVSILAAAIGAFCTVAELRAPVPDEGLIQASVFICVAGVVGMCAAAIWGACDLWGTI